MVTRMGNGKSVVVCRKRVLMGQVGAVEIELLAGKKGAVGIDLLALEPGIQQDGR